MQHLRGKNGGGTTTFLLVVVARLRYWLLATLATTALLLLQFRDESSSSSFSFCVIASSDGQGNFGAAGGGGITRLLDKIGQQQPPQQEQDDGEEEFVIRETSAAATVHDVRFSSSTPRRSTTTRRRMRIPKDVCAAAAMAAADDDQTSSSTKSEQVIAQLKVLYKLRVKPLEQEYQLYKFGFLPSNSEITDQEFDSKPMVLLIGQYSTGKTTFIQHLLQTDFPGMHIGPEPTTDKFMAMIYGDEEEDKPAAKWRNIFMGRQSSSTLEVAGRDANVEAAAEDDDGEYGGSKDVATPNSGKVIQGNTLLVTPDLPFSTLTKFGAAFLDHFVGSVCAAPLLKRVMLVDTPGVLSGEKHRIARSYDFGNVAKWFADRSDLILLLFDAHKLDVSDEMKEIIELIRPHNYEKIRCVLNKADGVTKEQMVRVYGR